ncbi:unnamed protein product [Lathyrus sativus]|nr:unnamed protein product [Lathyrus sativus]
MTKPGHINAAFRSSFHNEIYFFVDDKYFLFELFANERTSERIFYELTPLRDGFKSLNHTIFGTYGIDCSFDTDNNEAYIFYENFCALIDYAPHSDKDKIISGPKKISDAFPFLKGTVFENGVDAAYRSTIGKEVYLFKGDKYARIDYGKNELVQSIKKITEGFPCFSGTILENGVDAAFACHIPNEVFFFKDEYYARVVVTPGATDDYIKNGVRKTLEFWPNLNGIKGLLD